MSARPARCTAAMNLFGALMLLASGAVMAADDNAVIERFLIQELQSRYAMAHDLTDPDLYAAVFTEDAELYSGERLLAEIWQGLTLNHGVVGIIGERGKPEGAVLLRIGNMWYSDQQVIEEKAIFIHPDYRSAKGGRARKLVEFSKQVADRLGLPLIIGVLSNQRTEAKVRLYERQFGKASGAFFLYNCRTGETRREAAE